MRLLDGIFARGAAAQAASEHAFLQAVLDAEAALARACARERLTPDVAAEAIAAACRAERFDVVALAGDAGRHAQPVVPIVAALREAVGGEAAEHVHRGATSQDIVDTALMLVAWRSLAPMVDDLSTAADGCAALAEAHAATPVVGRTLLQQAVPTTFGLKAAGWMTALDAAAAGLTRVRDTVVTVQLGGPVGSLHAPALVDAFADELGLAMPVMAWHSDRRRPAELAGALGVAAGATAKLAGDVALLSQSEVGEVRGRARRRLVVDGAQAQPGGVGLDPPLPPGHSEQIAHGIPGARYELLDRAAHIPMAERPDAIAALILEATA